ncbi:MAG TPA: tRNA (adenosine(37)-N6)-threonylcarbamoyltransferase complex dimerization subunit type 1 TsaB [Rhodocyclaceae bacterium]|jgi:tRNA threonylcarbamoyladenosine biosynthesis protein TsaB|nr:tRNA (adenosine(37)-N6)-threonylcarbamoyltransferase complex dimerization subunit type 1 TsaB [Rhodocyclaceae bacterium]
MKLLACETSSDRCSVALWADGACLSRAAPQPRDHSEIILPFVGELLAEAGLQLRQLDAIAFGAGPGGFTGLRLGCSVAQGLALAAGLPVIPVDSLAALALAAGDGPVYACVDARMNEVYCAAYRVADGEAQRLLGPVTVAPALAPLPPAGHAWHGAGSGFGVWGGVLRERLGGLLDTVSPDAVPDAVHVARLAVRGHARGEARDPAAAAPAYVRDKVALTTAERLAAGARA